MNRALEVPFGRLESLRSQLIERLRSADPERLGQPARKGGWSPLEIVEHLSGAEERSLEYILFKIDHPDTVPAAGIGSRLRSTALRVALRLPLRFKAPESVARPKAAESLEPAITRWDEIRDRWRELLESYPTDLLRKAIFRHPVAGRIDIIETLKFHRSHLERHGAQIRRGLQSRDPAEPSARP